MPHFETRWPTTDGLNLYGQGWTPPGKTKAVISLVHGVGEHSGRYEHVANFFNEKGYTFYAFDHRGHGKSPGPRGHFPTYETVMQDIACHLEQTKKRFPNKPVVLYGHSMGGNLVLNFVLRHHPDVTGVIVTSPLLRLSFQPPKIKIMLANLLMRVWPTLSMPSGLDTADFSHDPEANQKYDDDPLNHKKVTPCFLNLIEAGEWALEHADKFPKPLLLMHGGADRITSAENSRVFAEKAGDQCTLKIWDNLYHELHNEYEKQDVLETMVKWIRTIL